MSELAMLKRLLMIDKCNDPKKLRRHCRYWAQKVENLNNDPLESEKDIKYVAMFQKLVEFATAQKLEEIKSN